MSYLDATRKILAEVDGCKSEIDRLVSSAAQTDPEVVTWYSHFTCAWAEIYRQLGWPVPRSRTQRLLKRLRELLGTAAVPIPEISFRSPIFDEETDLGMPFHPSFSKVPTEYGFKICATGRDMWHPLASGHYLTELSESVITMTFASQSDCFIDVGANVGFFSFLFAAQATRGCRVIACEPSAENVTLLKAGIEENGFQNKISVLPVAVGNNEGRTTLHLNQLGSGGNTVLQVNDESFRRVMGGAAASFPREQSVQVTKLDSVFNSCVGDTDLPFIKIDVEGYEKNVLGGAEKLLTSSTPPVILYEAWPNSPLSPKGKNHVIIAGTLERFGYDIWRIEHAKHGEPLISAGKLVSNFRQSTTGNYLAVPRSCRGVEQQFLRPLDIRIFTGLHRLSALSHFLRSCLKSLTDQIQTEKL